MAKKKKVAPKKKTAPKAKPVAKKTPEKVAPEVAPKAKTKPVKLTCQACGREFNNQMTLTKHKCSGPMEEGFKVEFKRAPYFSKCLEVMSSWCDNVLISMDEDSFFVESRDLGAVAFVQLITEKPKFRIFNKGLKNNVVVVNSDDFKKVLARGSKDDSLLVELEPTRAKLKVVFKTKTGRNRTFRLGILDEEDEDFKGLKTLRNSFANMEIYDWKVFFNIDPNVLHEIIADAAIITEVLNFKTKDEEDVLFDTVGASSEFEGQLGHDELKNLFISEATSSKYGITMLKNILKVKGMTRTLGISFESGRPILFNFELKNGMLLNYIQAPRVEEQDEYGEDEEEEYEDAKEAVDAVNKAINESEEFEDPEEEFDEEFDEEMD